MYFEFTAKNVGDKTDHTWKEKYDSSDSGCIAHMPPNSTAKQYAQATVKFWNDTIRPHEKKREILSAHEIDEKEYNGGSFVRSPEDDDPDLAAKLLDAVERDIKKMRKETLKIKAETAASEERTAELKQKLADLKLANEANDTEKRRLELRVDEPEEEDMDAPSVFGDKYNDPEFFARSLEKVRECFGNPETTRRQYDAMQSGLLLAQARFAVKWRSQLEALTYEARMRRVHYEQNIWDAPETDDEKVSALVNTDA